MRRDAGFSIVELLIAMTIGLVLTGGALTILLSIRSSFSTTTGVGVLSDDGRFALDFLRSSIRGAGFIGCSDSSANPSVVGAPQIINALNGSGTMPFNFNQALGGYEYKNTSPGQNYALGAPAVDATVTDWTPSLDASLNSTVPPSGVAGAVAGSDVIVIRTGTTTAPVNVTAITSGANNFTTNSSTGFAAGQLAVISNCAVATTFQISGVASGNVISHASGTASGTNVSSSFTYPYSAGAMLYGIDTQVYYIGIGADGDGALMRLDLNGGTAFSAQELVPDVENMQVLYGYDANGTQSVSQYYTANSIFPAVLNPAQIMTVKIAVLVATPPNTVPRPSTAQVFNLLGTQVTAPQDTRQRQVFDATIALRNAVP